MKKLKKLLLMGLLAGTMALVTGCGSSEQKETDTLTTEVTESTPTEE